MLICLLVISFEFLHHSLIFIVSELQRLLQLLILLLEHLVLLREIVQFKLKFFELFLIVRLLTPEFVHLSGHFVLVLEKIGHKRLQYVHIFQIFGFEELLLNWILDDI